MGRTVLLILSLGGLAVRAVPQAAIPDVSTVVAVAAGDLCDSGGACSQTAYLLDAIGPAAVFVAGDNAYESGTLAEYTAYYHPNWGRFKSITRPSPGNHEYVTAEAAGYFDYFNGAGQANGPAGDREKGYYSWDIGAWHFVALNSNVARKAGSTQEQWLRADLAANTQPCTGAYWHYPRFSHGNYGDSAAEQALWQALYDHHADLVVVGHDHNYQRYKPLTPTGTLDPAGGIRQFVVGTGGRALYPLGPPRPIIDAENDTSHGVLELTLNATGYAFDFVPVPGDTFTDHGSARCHNAPAPKGDLDADGQPDIVFRNVPNGLKHKVWFMNGTARIAEAPITPDASATSWLIRGVDDFDSGPGSGRDGRNDLVFWNQNSGNVEFWLMNGTSRVGAPVALVGAVLPPNWDLSATADFNHDTRPDIVWRDLSTQKISIWTMNGVAKAGEIVPSPDQAVNANWTLVAAADYDNDQNTDFLWYNASSGKLVTWHMNALVVRTSGQFTTPDAAGDSNWKVVASSDYSGASGPGTPPLGSPDILWRNATSGNQVVWHLDFNSTRVLGEFTSPAANAPAADWVIVGPR